MERKELTLLDICWSIFSSLVLGGVAIHRDRLSYRFKLDRLDFEGRFPRSVCGECVAIGARNRNFEGRAKVKAGQQVE